MDKKEIIESLKLLCEKDSIDISKSQVEKFAYSPINEYIESMKLRAKPETATGDLFRNILKDILDINVVSEVNINNSFIDFVINESGISNPVCIELKYLFRFTENKTKLIQNELKYTLHQEQIQKYLKHERVEYVILTNINLAYIFNRTAIIDFKPIAEVNFYQLLDEYLIRENFWDTVRRHEDKLTIPNLDNEFFIDLKKWFHEFDNVQFREVENLSKDEIIVLFLNKFIFIKTLEDFGLIPYKFIQDEYERYVFKWKAKGYNRIFKHFFYELETFFEVYYDTELFSANFWDFIEDSKQNIELFKSVFEKILGLDRWSLTFGKGLVHYNYRYIDEDIFGKAYETWIAENRKDEGIFYTPAAITEYMANKLVDTMFDEPVNKLLAELIKTDADFNLIENLTEEIKCIRIIDSSSGSGSFLIKVLRAIYKKYQLIDQTTAWAKHYNTENLFGAPGNISLTEQFRKNMNFDTNSELTLISSIILNHIFAADKDEKAIETAKTNIWKEAVKLNPRIYNYVHLNDNKIHILPNLEMNLIKGDSLTDNEFSKQIEIIHNEFREELINLFRIRNEYVKDPYSPEIINEALVIKKKIRKRLLEEGSCFKDSLFFPLEFFFCFFSPDGEPLPPEQQGFSGVISNPPWEELYPVKKEFASKYPEFTENITGKYSLSMSEFDKYFNKILKEHEEINQDWNDYKDYYKTYYEFMISKYSYFKMKPETSQALRSHVNIFKLLMERNIQLIKDNAYFINLVPSSFQTDEGSYGIRLLLTQLNTLIELISFENRGYNTEEKKQKVKLFPGVHPQFKFSIVFSQKKKSDDYNIKTKFYLVDPEELYNKDYLNYNLGIVKQFSPLTLSIMEFKSVIDYDLCVKIKSNHKIFWDNNYKLRREFNMTDDDNLFKNMEYLKQNHGVEFYRLYEGKMIHQFNSGYDESTRFISKEIADEELFKRTYHRLSKNLKVSRLKIEEYLKISNIWYEHQYYRLSYRAIGRSTDERTLITSIIPKFVVSGNSLNQLVSLNYEIVNDELIVKRIEYSNLILLMSLLNSLTLNYYIRNKVSANLNMFYIYELPIAEASEEDKQKIIELGFRLLYRKSNKSDFEDLKKELNLNIDNWEDLSEIRAELEVIIAKNLYGLEFSEWEYLTSTFTYGGESETKAELDEIIIKSKEMWKNK